MKTAFTPRDIVVGFSQIAHCMDASRAELNELDGKLGDGDIGITMDLGCKAAVKALEDLPDEIGATFMLCAKAFVGARASSFGTLVATGLLAVGAATHGKATFAWTDWADLFQAAVTKMAARGKSELGQKTVLDALAALETAARSSSSSATFAAELAAAVDTAVETFRNKPNGVGRARIFAEKSIGIPDPGMVVIQKCVHALVGTK